MLSLEASQKWDLSVTKCYWTSLSSIRRRTRVYSHRCALHEIGVTSWDRQGQGCHSAQPRRKGPIGTLVISARILWSAAAGRINPLLRRGWLGAAGEKGLQGLDRSLSMSPQHVLAERETSIEPWWAGTQPLGWENRFFPPPLLDTLDHL